MLMPIFHFEGKETGHGKVKNTSLTSTGVPTEDLLDYVDVMLAELPCCVHLPVDRSNEISHPADDSVTIPQQLSLQGAGWEFSLF